MSTLRDESELDQGSPAMAAPPGQRFSRSLGGTADGSDLSLLINTERLPVPALLMTRLKLQQSDLMYVGWRPNGWMFEAIATMATVWGAQLLTSSTGLKIPR